MGKNVASRSAMQWSRQEHEARSQRGASGLLAFLAISLLSASWACSTASDSSGGGGCGTLASCCSSLNAAEQTACNAVVMAGIDATCAGDLQTYQSSGLCRGGSQDGGGPESGGGCGALAACCPALEASQQSGCNQVVATGNATACGSELAVYQSSGSCGGIKPPGDASTVHDGDASLHDAAGDSDAHHDVTTTGGPLIDSLSVAWSGSTSTWTVSAVVSDTASDAAISGGVLIDTASGASYGAFSTSGGTGTFQFLLTVAAVNAVSPLDWPVGGEASRTLTAQFFDDKGATTSQNADITLSCPDPTSGGCGGVCEALENDPNNCGACGNVCGGDACCGGTCVATVTDDNNCGGCGIACSAGDRCCASVCTNTQTDYFNCGTCGDACSGSQACSTGSCVPFEDIESLSQSCGQTCASLGAGWSCVQAEAEDSSLPLGSVSCGATVPQAAATYPMTNYLICGCIQ